jgi:hypothetical protein
MASRTTPRTYVVIIHEPFGFPQMPFGIYELTPSGLPGRELARARSREEALRLIRRMGWIY